MKHIIYLSGLLVLSTLLSGCRTANTNAPTSITSNTIVSSTLPNGLYNVRGYASNRCLYIRGGEQEGKLLLQDCIDTDNQSKIHLSEDSRGLWTMQFDHSGLCLEYPGDQTGPGVPLQESSCTSDDKQKWEFIDLHNGYFVIRNQISSKCIYVAHGSVGSDAEIDQDICAYGDNISEMWKFENTTHYNPPGPNPQPSTPEPTRPVEAFIGDASVCTPQQGFAYYNCQLGLHNSSSKDIMVISVTWSGLKAPSSGQVEKNNIVVPAGQTVSNLELVWDLNSHFDPTTFHVTKAVYK